MYVAVSKHYYYIRVHGVIFTIIVTVSNTRIILQQSLIARVNFVLFDFLKFHANKSAHI